MRRSDVFWLALLGCSLARGQLLMEGSRPGGPTRLLPSDAAVLESHEARTDLPCEVKPQNPALDYDLTFHAGYQITIPLRALAGTATALTAILRVTPEGVDEPVYFSQKWAVPNLEENVRGDADLHGTFLLGEGKYQVAWLLRDDTERYCAAFWQVSASLRGKDRQVALNIAPSAVDSAMREPFRDEEPVQRDMQRPLSVTVLLHVAPQGSGGADFQAGEIQAMLSILRSITRERRFTQFSLTAFNVDQRTVIHRQGNVEKIDFPALGRAVKELHFGTVSLQTLADKDGGPRFLAGLFAQEFGGTRPDLLMIVGPKTQPDDSSLRSFLKQLPDPPCPVFYLNYSSDRETNPWRDLLSSVVKYWNGMEYTITNPRDLSSAWSGVMSRVSAKPKQSGTQDEQ